MIDTRILLSSGDTGYRRVAADSGLAATPSPTETPTKHAIFAILDRNAPDEKCDSLPQTGVVPRT
jgi:hypothetical protein